MNASLVVRPIEPDDAQRLARMFTRLSPTSVYRRFFSPIPIPPTEMLERMATVDHACTEALVALDGDEVVAVAQYNCRIGTSEAEIAVTVEDAWQHRGVGRMLSRRLARVAMEHGYERFVATMLPDNQPALRLLRSLSDDAVVRFDGGTYAATVPLPRAS